jgi:hypothetical protein
LLKCEVCGRAADKHHIIHRCEGGLEFPLNYKYLCLEHHRGRRGPHRDAAVDMQYKLELQSKLEKLLCEEYYTKDRLAILLELKVNPLKRLLRDCRRYKEGYRSSDIIYRLMGRRVYSAFMLESYDDFIPVFNFI